MNSIRIGLTSLLLLAALSLGACKSYPSTARPAGRADHEEQLLDKVRKMDATPPGDVHIKYTLASPRHYYITQPDEQGRGYMDIDQVLEYLGNASFHDLYLTYDEDFEHPDVHFTTVRPLLKSRILGQVHGRQGSNVVE